MKSIGNFIIVGINMNTQQNFDLRVEDLLSTCNSTLDCNQIQLSFYKIDLEEDIYFLKREHVLFPLGSTPMIRVQISHYANQIFNFNLNVIRSYNPLSVDSSYFDMYDTIQLHFNFALSWFVNCKSRMHDI